MLQGMSYFIAEETLIVSDWRSCSAQLAGPLRFFGNRSASLGITYIVVDANFLRLRNPIYDYSKTKQTR